MVKEFIQDREVLVVDEKTEERLHYSALYGEDLALIHIKNREQLKILHQVNFDYWDIIAIVPYDFKQYPKVETQILPPIEEYQEKYNFFKERFEDFNFEKGMKQLLIRLLIRKPEQYAGVMTYLKTKNPVYVLDLEDLQYVLGDTDVYDLEEFLCQAIFGLKPRRTPQMLNYFVHVRNYAPNWILNQLKEMTLTIAYFYELKRRGVVREPLSESQYQKRVKVLNWTPIENFPKWQTQRIILEQIKNNNRQDFGHRARKIFNLKQADENTLYALVTLLGDPS